MTKFTKVVIWGHKLHSHTCSYVNYGFYKAFDYLGIKVLWLDNNDDISNIDFDNSLFLTEGQVDEKIPLNSTCFYVIHNCKYEKYQEYKHLNLQIFHNHIQNESIPNTHSTFCTTKKLTKINDYTYYSDDTLFQPWATDLLPIEISLDNAHNELVNKECVWVGTYGDREGLFQNGIQLDLFFDECYKNNINVKIIDPWSNPISFEENRKIIRNSFISPSIQGPWQVKYGYAPHCRILKNISYGHFGITNNEFLNQLFDHKLIYDNDPSVLFYKCLEKKYQNDIIDEIKFLMNEVKMKHCFVNRVNVLFDVINILS